MRMTQAEVNAYEARRKKAVLDAVFTPLDGCEVESELHNQILQECRRRGWIALHGSMASPTRRTAGEPDFILVTDIPRGACGILFIECKTRTGKLSPAQQAFHAHAAKLGHTVHVVRSFQEFLNLIG